MLPIIGAFRPAVSDDYNAATSTNLTHFARRTRVAETSVYVGQLGTIRERDPRRHLASDSKGRKRERRVPSSSFVT